MESVSYEGAMRSDVSKIEVGIRRYKNKDDSEMEF